VQTVEEGECVDWGTDWQNDPSHHMHSTSDQPEISFEQPRSSKHSDFQQQKSENCQGAESIDTVG
jgi:hypothetical protein